MAKWIETEARLGLWSVVAFGTGGGSKVSLAGHKETRLQVPAYLI